MLSSILNLGLVAAMFLQLATATDHTVGSPAGTWDLATDLQTWASSANFFAGDTLTFQYPASHNVLEVSKTDFESCTTSNPLTEDASGNTVVLLKASGKRYFICGMAGHCSFGMKMEVIVNPTNPPPSFSAPSKPPRSFSTPSKPPPFVPKPPSFSAPSNPPPSFKAPKPPSFSAPSNPPPSFKSPKPPSFSAPPNPPPSFKVPKHPSFKSPSPKAAASPPPSSSAPSKSPYSSSMAPQPSTAPAGAASLPTTTSSSTKRGTLQSAVMAIAIAVASIALHALQF